MISRLSLRGIPLDRADVFSEIDQESSIYKKTQVAFIEARGAGTPLLDAEVKDGDAALAPYMRIVITDLLIDKVNGGSGAPIGDAQTRAALEARLALIEKLAMDAAMTRELPEVLKFKDAPDAPFVMKVKRKDRPEWIDDAVMRSTLRRTTSAQNVARLQLPDDVVTDAVHTRLGRESRFWQGIDPRFQYEKDAAAARSKAMREAIGLSTRIDVPIEETAEEFIQSEFPTSPEFERVAELMAARVKSVGGGNLEIGTNAATTTALRYFAEYTPTFGDNDKAMTVYGIGIHKFLQENDVMRSYVKFV